MRRSRGKGARFRKQEELVTVVDTIPATGKTKLALTNPSNGFRNVRNASGEGGVWAPLVNTATQGVHTQRNWLSAASGNGGAKDLDWADISATEKADHLTKESVYYRLNTKGTDTAQLAELFLAPQETYQYAMVAGKTTDYYPNTSLYQTDARLLVNTTAVQAAAGCGRRGTGCHQVGTGNSPAG